MGDDRLDLALLLEILQAPPRQGAVDLQSVDEGGDCDKAVRLDIFVELLGGGLVKQDGVLSLVLDCKEDARSAEAHSTNCFISERSSRRQDCRLQIAKILQEIDGELALSLRPLLLLLLRTGARCGGHCR